MKEFVKNAGAVAVGTLVASGVAVCVLLNKKVAKAYINKVVKTSMEVTEEVMETMYEE